MRRMVLTQRLGGLADLALAGQEDQHIPGAFAGEFVHRIDNRLVEIALLVFLVALDRAITHLDRIQPAADFDDGRRPLRPSKVLGKALRIDRCRGDDDLQVRPARQELLQIAEQEIDVEAALVRLVDDDRVVSAQQRIVLRFSQQDAVGHQLDRRAGRQRVVKAHLIAHVFAHRRANLLRNPLGRRRGGNPARLRMADQPGAARANAPSDRQADLRQLRGLARAGFTRDDHHLVLGDGLSNLIAAGRNRQRLRKRDRRDTVGACATGFQRGGELFRRRFRAALRTTISTTASAGLALGRRGVFRRFWGGCRRAWPGRLGMGI